MTDKKSDKSIITGRKSSLSGNKKKESWAERWQRNIEEGFFDPPSPKKMPKWLYDKLEGAFADEKKQKKQKNKKNEKNR